MIDVERLKSRLAALELNPNSASQKAGLGRDYVRDILRGRIKDPSALRLRRLAEALECSPSYLLGQNESEWGIDRLGDVDDRQVVLGDVLERAHKAVNEPSKNAAQRVRFASTFFELLDSVSDRTLVELSYASINTLVHSILDENIDLSSAEKGIILGETTDDIAGAWYERRLILAKLLRLINKTTYYSAICVGYYWRHVKDINSDDVLSDSEGRRILEPLLKRAHVGSDAPNEAVRLALISVVGRFLTATDPTSAASAEEADSAPAVPARDLSRTHGD